MNEDDASEYVYKKRIEYAMDLQNKTILFTYTVLVGLAALWYKGSIKFQEGLIYVLISPVFVITALRIYNRVITHYKKKLVNN